MRIQYIKRTPIQNLTGHMGILASSFSIPEKIICVIISERKQLPPHCNGQARSLNYLVTIGSLMKPTQSAPMTLLDFILQGKISGYASGGGKQEKSFDDGSRGFEFTGYGYRYVDRYYGFNPFTGTEHIFSAHGALLWVMNYYGLVYPTCSDATKVYTFLREAMRLVSPEYPFRGPALFEKGSLKYENQQQGTLDCFYGTESIFENHEEVYFLHYHGGKVATPEAA